MRSKRMGQKEESAQKEVGRNEVGRIKVVANIPYKASFSTAAPPQHNSWTKESKSKESGARLIERRWNFCSFDNLCAKCYISTAVIYPSRAYKRRNAQFS